MPPLDQLLTPIPGANPAGADLRYDPLYEKIKEARREDDDAPQGEWERDRKLADWPAVIKLATDALATKSKDLQVAAWLTEALLRKDGFGGLGAGLGLLKGLIEGFWDQLHPEPEDGDLELRVAPLDWIGTRLDIVVKSVPLNKAGHDYFKYKESRAIPSEKDAEKEESKAAARQQALGDGKLSPEEFDKAFGATPKTWYRQVAGDLEAALAMVEGLDAVGREKFGDVSPNFIPLRESLQEMQRSLQTLLAKKLQQDPDPAGAAAPGAPTGAGAGPGASSPGGLAPEPMDRDDANARVVGAARFIRRTDPTSPVSYLVLRALRWGELRAGGNDPDPRLMEAPPSQLRTQLKTLHLDQDWQGLLEAAEAVMGSPAGRGWLDLQRYTLNAVAALGPDYEGVARAMQRELRGLLAEIPTLTEMTLMDDLPTAGPATLAWLRTDGLLGEAAGAEAGGEAPPPAAAPARMPASATGPDRLFERALGEARAGRAQKGIELLKRELDRETSARGRFMRQTQLAHVMVEAGLEPVAAPMLEELIRQIEAHKLEEWEAGSVVAEPMALLYRCIDKVQGDPAVKQSLYLRICRLDPMRAMEFGQQPMESPEQPVSDGETGT